MSTAHGPGVARCSGSARSTPQLGSSGGSDGAMAGMDASESGKTNSSMPHMSWQAASTQPLPSLMYTTLAT
jgi:hypothetical protein